MAKIDHQLKKIPRCPLLCLLCFISIFLLLSLSRGPSLSKQTLHFKPQFQPYHHSSLFSDTCHFSDGSWIYEQDPRRERYDNTCREIFKGWNCIANNKSNAREINKWRWQPKDCDLSAFDPQVFLYTYRDTNIGFVGDSLNRNMFVSLFCILKSASSEVKKWRPAGADRGFTFLRYNLTFAYHRINLLVRYGSWSSSASGGVLESLGYKDSYRVDVDISDGTWVGALSFHDILIFNTGHWWWAPSKFDPIKSPMIFFENGQPVIPPVATEVGFDKALKHMVQFVDKEMQPGGIKFFRTQSPRHFEGGDWDQGCSCPRLQPLLLHHVEELFSVKNQHAFKAVEGSNFHILDVTRISEFRADAHPSTAVGKRHNDYMHWCLPGITDTWNDMLIMYLNRIKSRS
ncbi:hypothetical protein K2173_007627 [Erythroxylum novogranatense]|uniref:Trichome birefringence-like N-terminal domain-containing protein n=1 Tax=Erythroxylum novogranatense TaxID=1862640 RepID=A0AAV8TS35_9ROSI|nr:hypothetical protein K2173_007627 [Erythroxylum novogranatense]